MAAAIPPIGLLLVSEILELKVFGAKSVVPGAGRFITLAK